MKPLHRDDVPHEVAEEITKALRAAHPGGLPPEVADMMKKLESAMAESLAFGRCFDCNAQMPGYPAQGEPLPDDWQPAEGWVSFDGHDGDIAFWVCPTCDQADEDDE